MCICDLFQFDLFKRVIISSIVVSREGLDLFRKGQTETRKTEKCPHFPSYSFSFFLSYLTPSYISGTGSLHWYIGNKLEDLLLDACIYVYTCRDQNCYLR